MKLLESPMDGLKIIEPRIFLDGRGYFFEVYQQNRYADLGIPNFVQSNTSRSKQNTLRGLHYQLPNSQGKLVWITRGAVWDVVVDIRLNSVTFGKWFGITLSDENHLQMYIPPGFAHGFCVLSEEADFNYNCTDFYAPQSELGIAWNDATLNIPWPVKNPILSSKDEIYPQLRDVPHDKLFP